MKITKDAPDSDHNGGRDRNRTRGAEPTPGRRLYHTHVYSESLLSVVLAIFGVVFGAFVVYKFVISTT